MKKKLIIVCGPTGSGKTSLSIELAKKINGEIINADSRQFYKYLDIGTSKGPLRNLRQDNAPTLSSLKLYRYSLFSINIHLVSFLEIDEIYNIKQFQQDVYSVTQNDYRNELNSLLVGGSGLYIDSIFRNYDLDISANDQKFRSYLNGLNVIKLQQLAMAANLEVYKSLNKSDVQNPRRLIRTVERSRMKFSGLNDTSSKLFSEYEFLFLYPKYNWTDLKNNLKVRIEEMFKEGLVEETEKALSLGYKKTDPGLKVMGYREVINYLEGNISIEKAKELIFIAHRQLARRQRTWFEGKGRNYPLNIVNNPEEALNLAKKFLNK